MFDDGVGGGERPYAYAWNQRMLWRSGEVTPRPIIVPPGFAGAVVGAPGRVGPTYAVPNDCHRQAAHPEALVGYVSWYRGYPGRSVAVPRHWRFHYVRMTVLEGKHKGRVQDYWCDDFGPAAWTKAPRGMRRVLDLPGPLFAKWAPLSAGLFGPVEVKLLD